MNNLSKLIAILLLLITSVNVCAQQITGTKKDEIYFSSSQVLGYTCIGVGAGAMIYSSQPNNGILSASHNKTIDYVVGSALVATGIGLLIFGNKDDGKMKYWRGPEGYMPDSRNENYSCLRFDAPVFHNSMPNKNLLLQK